MSAEPSPANAVADPPAAASAAEGGDMQEQWVRGFDPQRNEHYYYGLMSGTVRSKPPEPTAGSVVESASEPLFDSAVRIQNVHRQRVARERVKEVRASRDADRDAAIRASDAESRCGGSGVPGEGTPVTGAARGSNVAKPAIVSVLGAHTTEANAVAGGGGCVDVADDKDDEDDNTAAAELGIDVDAEKMELLLKLQALARGFIARRQRAAREAKAWRRAQRKIAAEAQAEERARQSIMSHVDGDAEAAHMMIDELPSSFFGPSEREKKPTRSGAGDASESSRLAPNYTGSTLFADAETFVPEPAVVEPPGAPGCPTARQIGPHEVLLIWQQPGTHGGSGRQASDDAGYVLTFNTVRVCPAKHIPHGGSDDSGGAGTRDIEFIVPATHGEARYVVDGLATGCSYTFQVKARNIEGYGAWSMPSDVAVPLDPYRVRYPVEVRLGAPNSNYCLGEILVARDSTLSDARDFIRNKLRARGDGYREAPYISNAGAGADGAQDLSVPVAAASRQTRVLSLLQARLPHPDRYFFVASGGVGDILPRSSESHTLVMDVADGGAAADAKARSAEAAVAAALGGADVPRQCAQLYVQVEQQTVVQNVELHQYQPRYLEENVDFGDDVARADAEMAASAKGKARQRYKPKQKKPIGDAALVVDMSKATLRRKSGPHIEHKWDRRHQVIS